MATGLTYRRSIATLPNSFLILSIFLVTGALGQGILRNVTAIIDYTLSPESVDPLTGSSLLSAHGSLHVAATENDGGLRVSITSAAKNATEHLYLDAVDYAVGYVDGRRIGGNAEGTRNREVIALGQTSAKNADLVDPETGKGLLADLWMDEGGAFRGVYVAGSQGCLALVEKLATRLIPGGAQAVDAFKRLKGIYDANLRYTQIRWPFSSVETTGETGLPLRYRKLVDSDSSIQDSRSWNIEDPKSPKVVEAPGKSDFSVIFQDEAPLLGPESQPIATVKEEYLKSPAPFDGPDGDKQVDTRDTALARTGGKVSVIKMIGSQVAEKLGVVGAALSAAFVILDWVDGNWKGAAIGAADLGLAAGAAVAIAAGAGPVGWIVAGLITLFFAILPGLFKHHVAKPDIGNPAEVIQYAFFGDASHTGNEKCRKTNPDCVVAYGAGIIAVTFGWTYFDAIALLIHENEGYPMTIPDLAAAFQIRNKTASTTSLATIDCNNGHWRRHGRRGYFIGDDPRYCNHPSFHLSRDFQLPNLNASAAAIYDRIIPAPNGDCRLLNDASNPTAYPLYNITLTGKPASIACNLTAALNVSGIAIQNDLVKPDGFISAFNADPTVSNGTIVSPGSASTDGSSDGHVAAPPPAPFYDSLNSTNSVCIGGKAGYMCLPEGDYDPQLGKYGFYTDAVTNLTVVDASSLTVNIDEFQHMRMSKPRRTSRTYNTTQGPSDKGFQNDMLVMSKNSHRDGNHFTIVGPDSADIPQPPAACFFQKPDYKGDVFCVGPGGQNLSEPFKSSSQSISVVGNASLWIYSEFYGDAGGTWLTTNVSDLASKIYGSNSSFSNSVNAAWVLPTGGMANATSDA